VIAGTNPTSQSLVNFCKKRIPYIRQKELKNKACQALAEVIIIHLNQRLLDSSLI
jgi:hypothetical protein